MSSGPVAPDLGLLADFISGSEGSAIAMPTAATSRIGAEAEVIETAVIIATVIVLAVADRAFTCA